MVGRGDVLFRGHTRGAVGAGHMEMRKVLAGRAKEREHAEYGNGISEAHGTAERIGWLPGRQLTHNWPHNRALPPRTHEPPALKLTLDSLRPHLAGEPARAYLISGDEPLLQGEAADAIRARVKKAGFEEREVHFIEKVADWDDVRAASNNMSLFGSRKLIELRLPSGKPGVGGANAIVELLSSNNPDNIFLMLTGKLEREQMNSAWVKAFENSGAFLPVWPVEVARLPQWLRARAAALDLELDDAAVTFIVEHTEGNLLAAHQELEKLRMMLPAGKGKTRVDATTAQAGVGDSARFDVFQLGEAALGGDSTRALRILAGLRSEGVEPTLALWSLSREIHSCWGSTQSDGARGWHKPSAALEAAKRRAPKLPYARLASRTARVDRMIKGQARGDAWDEMALLVVEFSGKRTLPA
jgi:DNA polymerase-3 subunit delta